MPELKTDAIESVFFYKQYAMSHLLNPKYNFDLNIMLEDMILVLSKFNEIEWYAKVSWASAVNGQGHNQLRTYRLFKKELETECYFKIIS